MGEFALSNVVQAAARLLIKQLLPAYKCLPTPHGLAGLCSHLAY